MNMEVYTSFQVSIFVSSRIGGGLILVFYLYSKISPMFIINPSQAQSEAGKVCILQVNRELEDEIHHQLLAGLYLEFSQL